MVHLLLSSHQGKCTQEIFMKCLHCVFKIEHCSVGNAKNSPHPTPVRTSDYCTWGPLIKVMLGMLEFNCYMCIQYLFLINTKIIDTTILRLLKCQSPGTDRLSESRIWVNILEIKITKFKQIGKYCFNG